MKPFLTRTLSGAVYVILVVGSILGGNLIFGLFSLVLLFLSLSEYREIIRLEDIPIPAVPYYALNIVLGVLAVLVSNGNIGYQYLLIAVPLIFSIFLIPALSNQIKTMNWLGYFLMSIFYITIPLSLINFYHLFKGDSSFNMFLLSTFVILWLNDTFAYIVGSMAGKYKLSEDISPKKTWEGSIGGMIFSLGGATILWNYFGELSLIGWLGFALVIVIFGTFGDLFESALKRRAGLKESGTLIPGHGGILDRLDSLLLAAPFVFIYLLLVL
ncbi:MAG: phosphatidate cytidylyltransferase [Bacteroidetes bacterium]|nr:phosphatidate cytidylyltransferase [Bacteroidota bacterium]